MDTQDDTFVITCKNFRTHIADLCGQLIAFKNVMGNAAPAPGSNRGEEMSNLMLAYRHLEDAAMRVGKAIQAHTTGVSPLGGPTTPGTALPGSEDDGPKAVGNSYGAN